MKSFTFKKKIINLKKVEYMKLDYRINKINKTGLWHFPNLLSLKKVSEIKNKFLNKSQFKQEPACTCTKLSISRLDTYLAYWLGSSVQDENCTYIG